jgi:hypothetical protein|uniref:Uncharacterized protein n=1 Tax=Myoviridae sp. ctshb19 TaxID=2825194 RepID=A0A8S5UH89_9CAUD|nr:MAG TPA: hypothetical protein [Myoviridae sp. ctshb19]
MFVSVSNPDGIQHHGGQMAWDAVSDDRVVMMTYTKDNKALIQEINNSGGMPVVGPASHVANVENLITSGSNPTAHHMRPKICAVKGTDYVVAIIPQSFVRIIVTTSTTQPAIVGIGRCAAYVKRASAEITADAPYAAMPATHMAVLLQRDTGGLYKVLDSIAIPEYTISANTLWNPRYAVDLEFVSTTSVIFRQYYRMQAAAVGGLQTAASTLDIAGGKLTLTQTTQTVFSMATTAMITAYGVKKVRDRNGVYQRILALSDHNGFIASQMDYWYNMPYGIRAKDGGWLCGTQQGDSCARSTPSSVVLLDSAAQDTYYAVGHSVAGSNTLMHNSALTYLGNTRPVFSPIDTGFVTQDIVCVIGGADTSLSALTETTAVTDSDLAYSIAAKDKGDIRSLKLSFRMITGSGHFAGPFDPVTLPYWYGCTTNNLQILHKVSDTNFWLIGCWMDSDSAEPKIGVISVKPPAA